MKTSFSFANKRHFSDKWLVYRFIEELSSLSKYFQITCTQLSVNRPERRHRLDIQRFWVNSRFWMSSRNTMLVAILRRKCKRTLFINKWTFGLIFVVSSVWANHTAINLKYGLLIVNIRVSMIFTVFITIIRGSCDSLLHSMIECILLRLRLQHVKSSSTNLEISQNKPCYYSSMDQMKQKPTTLRVNLLISTFISEIEFIIYIYYSIYNYC